MIDLSGVVVLHGDGCIVEHRQEILLHVSDLRGVPLETVKHKMEMIGSEEYFDWMVEMGAKFCWIFTYMPVGSGAPTDLMASAEQWEFMYRQVRAFRKTKIAAFLLRYLKNGRETSAVYSYCFRH